MNLPRSIRVPQVTCSEMPDMSDRKEAAAAIKIRVNPHSVDTAWKYLDNHHSTTHGEDSDLKVLRRRVDWRIVPLAFLCYTMQFIDKVLINVTDICFPSSIPIYDIDSSAVCCSHGSAKGPEAEE